MLIKTYPRLIKSSEKVLILLPKIFNYFEENNVLFPLALKAVRNILRIFCCTY